MAKYQVVGITDERTECDCCGRKGLKATVALDILDAEGNLTGNLTYFGRDCAAHATYGDKRSKSVSLVEKQAKSIEYAKKWLGKTEAHTAKLIADKIRVLYWPCHWIGPYTVSIMSNPPIIITQNPKE